MTGAQTQIAAENADAAAAQAAAAAAAGTSATPAPATPVPAGAANPMDPKAVITMNGEELLQYTNTVLQQVQTEEKTKIRALQGKVMVMEAETQVSLARSRASSLPKSVQAHYLFGCDVLAEVKRVKAQLQQLEPNDDNKELLASVSRLERVLGARLASLLVAASNAGGDSNRVNWQLGDNYYKEAHAKAKLEDGVWSEVDFTEPNSKILKHVKETYGPGDIGASSSRGNTTTPARSNPPPRQQEQRTRTYDREGDSRDRSSKWPKRN